MNDAKMTDCEKQVMKVIWDSKNQMSLSTIVAVVNEKYDEEWRPQTVSTFLSRLVKKGYISAQRVGRQFVYIPEISQEDYKCEMLKNHIAFWNDNDISSFACDLYNLKPISEKQFKELKKKIDELDK